MQLFTGSVEGTQPIQIFLVQRFGKGRQLASRNRDDRQERRE